MGLVQPCALCGISDSELSSLRRGATDTFFTEKSWNPNETVLVTFPGETWTDIFLSQTGNQSNDSPQSTTCQKECVGATYRSVGERSLTGPWVTQSCVTKSDPQPGWGSQKQHPCSLWLSAQPGGGKEGGSISSVAVFIVYIKLGREELMSPVIIWISETCKLCISRV